MQESACLGQNPVFEVQPNSFFWGGGLLGFIGIIVFFWTSTALCFQTNIEWKICM